MPEITGDVNLYMYNSGDELLKVIAREEGVSLDDARDYFNDRLIRCRTDIAPKATLHCL